MPIYEYECANRHRFELRQAFDAEPRADCPRCRAAARRVILPVPVHYKGSGFYTTDYARSSAGRDGPSANGKSPDAAKPAKAAQEPTKASSDKPAPKTEE